MSKDKSEGLAFDGIAGEGYSRASNRYAGNHSGLTAKENYGRGPLKAGTTGDSVPNVTAASGKINGGAEAKCPTNADKINAGPGPRKGNE